MLYKRILNHGKRVLSTILVASMAVIPVASAKLAEVGGPVSGAFMEAASADDDEPPLLPQGAEDLLILEENTIDRHMEQIPGVEDEEEDQESLEKLNKRNERKEEFALFILGSEHEASKELAKPLALDTLLQEKDRLEKEKAEAREREIQAEKEKAAAREKERQAEKARAEAREKELAKEAADKVDSGSSQTSGGKFLIQISNPDKNYKGQPLKVSDRQALEGLVMGEWGTDYIGAVLVAQCIRDSMLKEGTNSAATIKRKYGYTAPIKKNVTDAVKRAVAYVFDEGGSGVQHPIYYFYASNLVKSGWHETQKFIVQRHAVRFFSRWR
ncbi:MAG TPA: hypothetical protein GX720_03135 [Clostridiaceae bacterium]|nr:hypothetical protein [Clostridiaceae bacterium]